MQDDRTDEELMETYKMGDEHAFEILFSRHSGKTLGFLTKRMHSANEGHDLLQETFLKLHRSKHLYNSKFPFAPWLFSISRSVLLDYFKKQNHELAMRQTVRENENLQSQEGPRATLDTEALELLPAIQKKAVRFRFYDEATFDEIAVRLSTSPENARQLVSRGIKKLKGIFNRGED